MLRVHRRAWGIPAQTVTALPGRPPGGVVTANAKATFHFGERSRARQGRSPMNRECVDVVLMTSSGGAITVALRGEMDGHTAPKVLQTLDRLLDPRMHIAIDLSGVTFIDSR